jgi:hypothetical protein
MFFPFFSLTIYLTIWGLMSLGILPDISSLFVLSAGLDTWALYGLM